MRAHRRGKLAANQAGIRNVTFENDFCGANNVFVLIAPFRARADHAVPFGYLDAADHTTLDWEATRERSYYVGDRYSTACVVGW